MTYRDDHDAALHRAQAAEREAKLFAVENKRLETELAEAREWLGGPRKRAILMSVVVGVSLLAGVTGFLIGRFTASAPVPAVVPMAPKAPLPEIYGLIVADGPDLGRWSLDPTRCVQRAPEGIELTKQGSTEHSIWITNSTVEVESPSGVVALDPKRCFKKLERQVIAKDTTPPTFDGFVDLDCTWNDNHIIGRITFTGCR